MTVKEFLKPTSKNGEIGRFHLESHFEPTFVLVSKALKDLFFVWPQLCLLQLKIYPVFIISSKKLRVNENVTSIFHLNGMNE